MRFIIYIILIIGIVIIGLMVLDYYGYYINWKSSVLSLSILIPILKAIHSFFGNSFKEVRKIKENINKH